MSTTIHLVAPESMLKARRDLSSLPIDGTFEVVIRKYSGGKTLMQLGALFGLWAKHVHTETGLEINDFHRQCKADHLAGIYAAAPLGDEQETWVELLDIYHGSGDDAAFERHFSRLSLAWARVSQMRAYMDAIHADYLGREVYLPVPDKDGIYKRWAA